MLTYTPSWYPLWSDFTRASETEARLALGIVAETGEAREADGTPDEVEDVERTPEAFRPPARTTAFDALAFPDAEGTVDEDIRLGDVKSRSPTGREDLVELERETEVATPAVGAGAVEDRTAEEEG